MSSPCLFHLILVWSDDLLKLLPQKRLSEMLVPFTLLFFLADQVRETEMAAKATEWQIAL